MSFKKNLFLPLGVLIFSPFLTLTAHALLSADSEGQSALRKAAAEELKYENILPATTPAAPAKRNKQNPVVIEESAQGILKLENPYAFKNERAYRLQLSFLGQKYQPRGSFKQDVGPDLQLSEYPELVLPSVEISTDQAFANNSYLSWGGHLGLSFITQTQRFSLGNSRAAYDDAQLTTAMLQLGPNFKYRLSQRLKWGLQVSGGVVQQTMTSPSAYLRHSQTTSFWSATSGPELMISSNILAAVRYEFRQLLSQADNVETQNNNVQLGLGFIW